MDSNPVGAVSKGCAILGAMARMNKTSMVQRTSKAAVTMVGTIRA